MLDLVINIYNFTINVSDTYKEYMKYPVDNTYNTVLSNRQVG